MAHRTETAPRSRRSRQARCRPPQRARRRPWSYRVVLSSSKRLPAIIGTGQRRQARGDYWRFGRTLTVDVNPELFVFRQPIVRLDGADTADRNTASAVDAILWID